MSHHHQDEEQDSDEDIPSGYEARRIYLRDDLVNDDNSEDDEGNEGDSGSSGRYHGRHYKHDRYTRYKKHSASIESLSSIPTQEDRFSSQDLKKVYQELQDISKKLQNENKILHEKEKTLKDKERSLLQERNDISRIIQHEVKSKVAEMEKNLKEEIEKKEQMIKEKTKENKRLKENFETLKTANDMLKRQLEDLQCQHGKLEKQALSLQSRLTNLQRKQEHADRQKETEQLMQEALNVKSSVKEKLDARTASVVPHVSKALKFDMLSGLLEWVSDISLSQRTPEGITISVRSLEKTEVQERCLKILPSLVDLLKEIPSRGHRICLSCLQFLYWSLLHIDSVHGQQKINLSSTLRRLGEELYKVKSQKSGADDQTSLSSPPAKTDKMKDNLYFRSSDVHIRFLSSLIILKTVNQVDHLAQVLEILRNDLKSDTVKELFIHYQATPVILHYLKPINKTLLNCAMDIYLQMSMESPHLSAFLTSCSTEAWFRACSLVVRMPNLDTKVIEKVSIVLQKLSKIKSNKKYFEVFAITSVVTELLREQKNENAFLALNLKSVLYNLTTSKSNTLLSRSSSNSSIIQP